MKKALVLAIVLVMSCAAAYVFAGKPCVDDAQCGVFGTCVKKPGYARGYCSN